MKVGSLLLSLLVWPLFLQAQVPAFSSSLPGASCSATGTEAVISGFTTTVTDFTATLQVTIPEAANGKLITWKLVGENEGPNTIYFAFADGMLQGYFNSGSTMENTTPVAVAPGEHTIKVLYDRARTGSPNDYTPTIASGVHVWIDNHLIYRQVGLRWENEWITEIRVSSEAVAVSQIDVDAGWKVKTKGLPSGVMVYIPTSATLHADGSFTLGSDALQFINLPTGSSAMTLSALAKLPNNATGDVMKVALSAKNNTTQEYENHTAQVSLQNGAYALRYNDNQSLDSTQTFGISPTTQWNLFTLTYNSDESYGFRGTQFAVNGDLAVQGSGIVWSGSTLSGLSITLPGVQIRELQLQTNHVALPKAPFGEFVSYPSGTESLSPTSKHTLYNVAYDSERGWALGEITQNGVPLNYADAAHAVLCFGVNSGEALAFDINTFECSADGLVTFGLNTSHPQIGGTRALLTRTPEEHLWKRVSVLSAPFDKQAAFSYQPPTHDATRFYKVCAEADPGTLGVVSAYYNNPSDCQPFPNMPKTAADTLTFTTSLNNPSLLNANAGALTLTLEGEALCEGMIFTLSDGEQTVTATLTALSTTPNGLPKGEVTFEGFLPPNAIASELTLTLTGQTHGGVTIVDSTWGAFIGQHRRVVAQLATDLVKDGFVNAAHLKPNGGAWEADSPWKNPANANVNPGENQNDYLFYRIPAMATDGEGLVHVAYDVRYGGGDLGDQRLSGLDLGGNLSRDYGKTWSTPFYAVNVLNFRAADGSWPYGKDRAQITREMDIGDASMLYDPKTETFWLMGITGGGLVSSGGGQKNDCVLYTRHRTANQWTPWTGGPEGNARSIKAMLKMESANPGILQGPGHGTVTRVGRGEMPAGTLLFPMQAFLKGGTSDAQAFVAYSIDNGKTWQQSGLTTYGTNAQENSVVELDDGSWLMMCKGGTWGTGKGKRLFYRTTDFTSWSPLATDNNIIHVQGSILRLGTHSDGRSRYVKCHQLDPDKRAQLTLIFGRDLTQENTSAASEGIAWDCGSLELFHEATGLQGYNTLCMLDDTTLGVCYESRGIIWFERIDISEYLGQ